MQTTTATAPAASLSANVSAQNGTPADGPQDSQNGAQAESAVARKATRKATTKDKDNREYFAFARRMLRAYGRRVQAEDPSDLAGLLAIRDEMDKVIAQTAASLNEQGFSWAEIAYGATRPEAPVTKTAAFKRWGRG
jgi:hypothetical protein